MSLGNFRGIYNVREVFQTSLVLCVPAVSISVETLFVPTWHPTSTWSVVPRATLYWGGVEVSTVNTLNGERRRLHSVSMKMRCPLL